MYLYRYVPAAVEISRTASSSGNSNVITNDHRNHTSKHDSMHQGHAYGVSSNNGGHPVNANIGFHGLVDPGLGSGVNGKSSSQRSQQSHHHHHSNYLTWFKSIVSYCCVEKTSSLVS